jgi:hypothetical protein
MAGLLARVPAFAFELGPEIALIPPTIDRFLEDFQA